jgi:DNA-directed RNA polymerase specialized sigma24 family protein
LLESGKVTDENIESTADILCEQYLPRVFQYISYRVNNTQTAEELTLKALQNAMIGCNYSYEDKRKLSTVIFASARKEVQDYLKMDDGKPILSNLSDQEQEVISLKLGAVLNNQMISNLLGLSESNVSRIQYQAWNGPWEFEIPLEQ